MTRRQANVLTVVGLLGLLATVTLTAPRWAGLLRSPAGPTETEEAAAADAAAAEAAAGETAAAGPSRRINVRLYFEAPDRDGLLPEEREVAFSADLAEQLRTVVEELVKGPTTELLATLPPGTRVQEVFVQARGVACVSLSAEASTGLPGGSKAELLTVYSIVNSIVTNFPAVRRVQLVVNDQVVSSLGGHVDLSRPLPADMTLLALEPPAAEPSPSPSPEPGAAAPPASPAPR
jgi:spore germination protein GerM